MNARREPRHDRPANPYIDPDHGLCATVTARHFIAVLLGMMLFTAVLLGALDRVLTAGLVRDAAALPAAIEQPMGGGGA